MAVRMWTHVDLSLSADSSFFAYLFNVEDKYIKKSTDHLLLLITFWDFAEEIAENFLLVYKRFVFVGWFSLLFSTFRDLIFENVKNAIDFSFKLFSFFQMNFKSIITYIVVFMRKWTRCLVSNISIWIIYSTHTKVLSIIKCCVIPWENKEGKNNVFTFSFVITGGGERLAWSCVIFIDVLADELMSSGRKWSEGGSGTCSTFMTHRKIKSFLFRVDEQTTFWYILKCEIK